MIPAGSSSPLMPRISGSRSACGLNDGVAPTPSGWPSWYVEEVAGEWPTRPASGIGCDPREDAMKISVNQDVCAGYGTCVEIAPGLFELDESHEGGVR
jgi:hypothetical protein